MFDDRDKLKCDYCGHSRHTKDQCWDVHEHPTNSIACTAPHGQGGGHSGGFKPSAHSVTSPFTVTEVPGVPSTTMPSSSYDNGVLSNDEIAAFRCFMSQLEPSSSGPTSSFAHPSITATTLCSSSGSCPSYVIGSGASHHMTGMSPYLPLMVLVQVRIKNVLLMVHYIQLLVREIFPLPLIFLCLPSFMFLTFLSICCLLVISQNHLTIVSHFFLLTVCFKTWKRRGRMVCSMRRMAFISWTPHHHQQLHQQ